MSSLQLFSLLLQAYNLPLDYISFAFIIWNFALVGILAIFWHGPTKVNQGYLILISGFLVPSYITNSVYSPPIQAIFFTRLPEWTTFAIVAIVAVYGT